MSQQHQTLYLKLKLYVTTMYCNKYYYYQVLNENIGEFEYQDLLTIVNKMVFVNR